MDEGQPRCAAAEIHRQKNRADALPWSTTPRAADPEVKALLQAVTRVAATALAADYVVVWLYDPTAAVLRPAGCHGNTSGDWENDGPGALPEVAVVNGRPRRAHQACYGARSVAAAAMARGTELIGTLNVTSLDESRRFGDDDLELLQGLADLAAMALINARSSEQRANADLREAYDRTLEGWSLAMDMRDKDTEGHTQRVTELAVRLAQAMDLSDSEIVHLRRGALLHDIGKIGIPDSILLKPEPLTAAEWEIMRRHPNYALHLLAPIRYLQPALDIPYCHHEKWDGSGYPRGLKGDEIPLAARIFAVVDVWDALRSRRPYRPAWSARKVFDHIRSQAGTHFDPGVVAVFLRMLS